MKLYHNPRCSKSREALAMLEQAGQRFETVAYLQDAPDAATVLDLICRADSPPAEFIRWADAGEAPCADISAAAAAAKIAAQPALLQRPVLDTGDTVRIGRPPDALRELLTR